MPNMGANLGGNMGGILGGNVGQGVGGGLMGMGMGGQQVRGGGGMMHGAGMGVGHPGFNEGNREQGGQHGGSGGRPMANFGQQRQDGRPMANFGNQHQQGGGRGGPGFENMRDGEGGRGSQGWNGVGDAGGRGDAFNRRREDEDRGGRWGGGRGGGVGGGVGGGDRRRGLDQDRNDWNAGDQRHPGGEGRRGDFEGRGNRNEFGGGRGGRGGEETGGGRGNDSSFRWISLLILLSCEFFISSNPIYNSSLLLFIDLLPLLDFSFASEAGICQLKLCLGMNI